MCGLLTLYIKGLENMPNYIKHHLIEDAMIGELTMCIGCKSHSKCFEKRGKDIDVPTKSEVI